MTVLLWIAFGLLIGIIMDLTSVPSKRNLLGASILGILGATLGGLLGNLVLDLPITTFHLIPFLVALVLSITVVCIQRSVSENG